MPFLLDYHDESEENLQLRENYIHVAFIGKMRLSFVLGFTGRMYRTACSRGVDCDAIVGSQDTQHDTTTTHRKQSLRTHF